MREMTKDEKITYALECLADGEVMGEIADKLGMKRPTLHLWLHATPEMTDKYARARELGFMARGDRLMKRATRELPRLPSGGVDSGAVAQLRIEVDAEKWLLSKLARHIFGESIAIGGSNEMPPIKMMTDDELARRIQSLKGQAGESS